MACAIMGSFHAPLGKKCSDHLYRPNRSKDALCYRSGFAQNEINLSAQLIFDFVAHARIFEALSEIIL